MVEPVLPHIRASDWESFEPVPGAASRFVRLEDLGAPIRVALTTFPPGTGANKHRHPEWQVFIVQEGRGIYSLDGVEVVAEPGDVVAVAPNALHGFQADGDVPLRHLSIQEPPHAHGGT